MYRLNQRVQDIIQEIIEGTTIPKHTIINGVIYHQSRKQASKTSTVDHENIKNYVIIGDNNVLVVGHSGYYKSYPAINDVIVA